jgi:hypothetical protein
LRRLLGPVRDDVRAVPGVDVFRLVRRGFTHADAGRLGRLGRRRYHRVHLFAAGEELGRDRQLVRRQPHRFLGQLLGHPAHLEQDATRFDHGDPALGRALAGAHAGFGRLLGVALVREDAYPDLAAAPDFAGHRDTGRFDLVVGHPA